MFKKLGNINKEPSKFSFNLSVDNIDSFKAPEVKPAPKTAPTYSIKWKRGDKRKGETTFVAPQGNRLIFNQTFKFSGTLFKEKAKKGGKTVYGKKLLSITLEEKGERNKITVLAKADVDLSEFVDEERELTNSTNVKLTIDKKTTSTLKLTINSKSLKDLKPGDEGYSTYTGVESENEDEEKSEKSGKDDESEKDEKSEKSESESTSSRSEKTAESASSDARTLEKKKTQDTESDKSNKTESEDEKSETEDDKTDEVSTPVKSTPPPKPTVTATATVAPKVASPASPTNNNHELELENKKLQKQVEDLQHKIQEVEQLKSKTESNNWAVMVKKIQKERDEVKEKMRSLELEMEQVKVESARAQQAQVEAEKVLNENNKKSQAEKQKLEKSIAELKDKTSNSKTKDRKNSAASPPADSGKVNQLMEQLDSIRQLETQRYLIEHSILFADPTCYVANSSVPEPTPVLLKALLSDDYSTKTKEATFPHHMIRAMEYMIERHADHLPTEAFWINVNTRLLSCLKKSGYTEQVSRALQQGLKDVVLDLMHASSNKRKGAQVQVPSILTGEQAPPMDGDELMQQLTRITMQAYFHVLDHVVKRLDPLIVLSILDHQDENTRAKSAEGGAHMREMLRVLDSFEKQLAANKMDARLQDFLFRTVALYIDATVFNELLRDVNNTSRYLQIKMGVQIVENWYEQHARQSEFKYSRQSADVCAIAQDVLIKDADMKNAVCPDLSKDQVAYLLANLRDEFSKSRTTNVQAPNTDVRLLFVSPIVKLSDDKDQPLLDFEADGNDKVKSAKISEKYTKRQGLEFLK